jgi:ABC-type phosphate/phosphonate transport system substrate-binding protein
MGADRVAALPMYDFPALRVAHDAFWSALAERLESGGLSNVPRELTRNTPHTRLWCDPSLLFAQGCEYPLAKSFADRVRVVATPMYSAAGCEGARYRSAVVVRAEPGRDVTGGLARGAPDIHGAADVHGGYATVGDLQGRRCVVNELDSNSGMNLLRAAVAPLARGGRFFDSVVVSGSHLRSVRMVASGEADVASIDCVSFAHLRRLYPSLVDSVRLLDWTASSPSLPFITARGTPESTVQLLRAALAAVFTDDRLASVRDQLLLKGIDLEPGGCFEEVLELERRAFDAGYLTLS